MTSVPASSPGARSLLRAPAAGRVSGRAILGALVVALVVGILGMHAVASHGTPAVAAASAGVSDAATAHVAAMSTDASHEEHAHAADARPPDRVAGSDSGSWHHQSSMVVLCVVVLAAVALTLLVLLVGGLLRPVLPAAFRPAAVRIRALQWVRGTGPPHEWQFSVIRC